MPYPTSPVLAPSLSLSHIIDTLNDVSTRIEIGETLLNLSSSDERLENRVKAIYLMGQYGQHLALIVECHDLLLKIYKHLLGLLMHARRDDSSIMVLHLIRSMGKLNSLHMPSANSLESIAVYLARKELETLFKKIETLKTQPEAPSSSNDVFIMLSVLDFLNNNVYQTEENKLYIGALFQSYLDKMMTMGHKELQKSAIRFICKWLPITNEEALLIGYEHCLEALLLLKKTFSSSVLELQEGFLRESEELGRKLQKEQVKVSLRAKWMRILIQAPGSQTNLLPIPGSPGFFCSAQSSLRLTKSILVDLPIHGKSNVSITRPIPSIPGKERE